MTEIAPFTLELPPALIEALAQRAAEIVAEQNAGYLDVKGAARFLGGCSPKRIYNLVERGAIPLPPTCREAAVRPARAARVGRVRVTGTGSLRRRLIGPTIRSTDKCPGGA